MLRKYFFLLLLTLLSASFFYFHLYDYLSLSTLKKYQLIAQTWTETHYLSAITVYMLVFTALIACAVPCATILALLGGFLFGLIAIVYAVLSTTCGGLILFLAVRTALGSRLAFRTNRWIKRMEEGFQKNAFNYILTLRLIPVFPCWISNIASGLLNVPVKTFICATVLGILPSNIIYVMAGRGLDKLLTDEKTPLMNLMLTPSVLFPLLGLAFLSLFPVLYKYVKK